MISHSLSTSLARSLAVAVVTGAALGGCAMMPCRACSGRKCAGQSMSKCGGCKAGCGAAKVKAGGCGACGAR